MKTPRSAQQGSMMLEALIAILIFSMGILAIVGLQASSIKLSSDAKYRTDASLLANQIIGQMWVSDRTAATLQSNFQGGEGTDGALYTAWVIDVSAALPGVAGGGAATVPLISVVPVVGTTSTSSRVTVTVRWQLPGEPVHQTITIAQII